MTSCQCMRLLRPDPTLFLTALVKPPEQRSALVYHVTNPCDLYQAVGGNAKNQSCGDAASPQWPPDLLKLAEQPAWICMEILSGLNDIRSTGDPGSKSVAEIE